MTPATLLDLLHRWLTARAGGTDLTARQLCPDRPDLARLLAPYLDRWRKREAPVRAAPEDQTTLPPREGSSLPTGTGNRKPPSGPIDPSAVPGYAIEKELGRGGMGVVFRARHSQLGRTVALKMILSGEYAGDGERSRFQNEAEAVARLPG
jgi:serine/threonine protein kinase